MLADTMTIKPLLTTNDLKQGRCGESWKMAIVIIFSLVSRLPAVPSLFPFGLEVVPPTAMYIKTMNGLVV